MAMSLRALLPDRADVPAQLIESLVLDSRQVAPGVAFVALPGATGHGLDYADEVGRRGAAAVLFDEPGERALPDNACYVPGLRQRLGDMADRLHGEPSAALTVVGITGTNGKTSCVQLLAAALARLGTATATIGTLGVGRPGHLHAAERTTPDVLSVHALLADFVADGIDVVAMEVSSHALDQGRIDGVRVAIAAFSQLSRDHLDYHGDLASYAAAKAKLFERHGLRSAVINIDDAFGRELAAACRARGDLRVVCVSSQDRAADLRATGIELDAEGLGFDIVTAGGRARLTAPIIGHFNVDNLLLVAGIAMELGVSLQDATEALSASLPVPGRMSRLGGLDAPMVVVDYAHTPDALTKAIEAVRAHAPGALTVVFGCGGNRDAGKRPLMAAAARAANVIIVTDDNPRHEDGDAIVADICRGFNAGDDFTVCRDRRLAIRSAIGAAAAGDAVLIAGKGHEAWQEADGDRRPFDDCDEAKEALSLRSARGPC